MTDFEAKLATLEKVEKTRGTSQKKITQKSIAQLIPPFIGSICKSPKFTEFRINYDAPTNQTTVKYSITWEDELGSNEKYEQILNKQGLPKKFGGARLQWIKSAGDDGSSHVKPESADSGSETNCSMSAEKSTSTVSSQAPPTFRLAYPSNNEIIGVKLVIIEKADKKGMIHTRAELEAQSDVKMSKVVHSLLQRRQRDAPEYLKRGTLYYAELQPDWSRKLRKVHSKDFEKHSLYAFPQIAEYILFVLDMGRFVEKGAKISLE